MSKKKLIAVLVFVLAVVLLNVVVLKKASLGKLEDTNVNLYIKVEADFDMDLNVFYDMNGEFSETKVDVNSYEKNQGCEEIEFTIKAQRYIRLDFGETDGIVYIYSADIKKNKIQYDFFEWLKNENRIVESNDIKSIDIKDDVIMISTADGDPYIIYDMIEGSADDNPYGKINKWMETRRLCVAIVLCILIDIIAVVAIKHIRALVALPVELWNNRQLIWGLSKNDFKTRFAGSYLGIVWAFIQPVVTVVVYWFVFTKGMRAGNMSNYPYILYLMTGLVPWFYFSEAWNGGTNSLLEYNYLVKKVVFKISILPMVKVISSIFVHMFFIAFIVVLSWCYGYTPSIYTLQIFYYVICSMILVLGLSYITCSVAVFFRDLTQIINIILQIGIWVTPIMWDPTNTLSNKWQIVLKLNPMCYIVNGFRNSLLGRQFFWNDLIWTLYFWIVVLLIFVIGVSVFKKLRVHFADVL